MDAYTYTYNILTRFCWWFSVGTADKDRNINIYTDYTYRNFVPLGGDGFQARVKNACGEWCRR